MQEFESKIKVKPLRRNEGESKFKLYKAALEWGLIDPIVIEKEADLKSKKNWQNKVQPYDHQVKNLITFCRRLPVTLLADDVGLGKTISAGLVMSELMSRNRISRVLIVCPKLLMQQWQEELESKFGIKSSIATGRELVLTDPPDEGAVITTYNSSRMYLDELQDKGYDMLILDEAHKLRNLYGVEKTPQVAKRFQSALNGRMFRYVLMLTATPIQNRLWDIYSLVDLLSTARGHENPFGGEGIFYRKFIGDKRDQAREIKPQAREEFRGIVYDYMSRIRRGDAELQFPERIVQRHVVDPTPEELELIKVVSESIEGLNRLSQIGILKDLVSSPHALLSRLNTMARKGTIEPEFRDAVKQIVDRTSTTAKLNGLKVLVEQLKKENPVDWRMVIFTSSRETQTSIQNFLEDQGIQCGIINGDTGEKNYETIQDFKSEPPKIHAIVSTEAGSEGVNLQCSNVLVNYDLPWNPMIVEQRIGRIQRLASKHANVTIFNMTLKNTFEEYIVTRLMEKLQMASHAIGDIEALLEASGIDEGSDDQTEKFEEKVLDLVLASLKGINVERAAEMAVESITAAKKRLEEEEGNIENMLGGMPEDNGPRSPKLPELVRSMDAQVFVLEALTSLGGKISEYENGAYICEIDGKRELIEFEKNDPKYSITSTLYKPGSGAFQRLVQKLTSQGFFSLNDADSDPQSISSELAQKWVESFGANLLSTSVDSIYSRFKGKVLLGVKVVVAHDSYECLLELPCDSIDHKSQTKSFVRFDGQYLDDISNIGISFEKLYNEVLNDPAVAEFCRFYEERKRREVKAAGSDERKRKKLEDEFTPRVYVTLEALDGEISREVKLNTHYSLGDGFDYQSLISVCPSSHETLEKPDMQVCEKSHQTVPSVCIEKCEISGKHVLSQYLEHSEVSGRKALPEFLTACTFTKKKVLNDEVQKSDVTGKLVLKSVLKKSDLSGKTGEPIFFGKCDFTGSDLLDAELCVSEVSGKKYRLDEALTSVVSGKKGHSSEFIFCSKTDRPLLANEAEVCEVTGTVISPGILDIC